ncbi:MAG: S41 family peptidase [Pseudomonadota bacterium]
MAQRFLFAIVLGLSFGLTVLLGQHFAERDAVVTVSDPQPDLLSEVMTQVEREYVDPVDEQALLTAAARGLVADLDNHSQYLDPEQYADLRVSARGNYSGVGLEVALRDAEVVVITAYPNSPAREAGIRHGDILIAIDDWPVASDELFDTVSRLRGQAGTSVTLSLLQGQAIDATQFTLERAPLAIPSVASELLAPGIGLLRLSQFHDKTAAQVATALDALQSDNLTPLTGLVIDLRDNPGGLLDAAVAVADLFLDEGLIVSARGRSESARFEQFAQAGSLASDANIVVLVNGASASAAEVLAAALRDHQRARLVGTSTFGKGLVQTVVPLDQGGAVKLTTSRYYTPDGDFIDNRGLTPDLVVRMRDGDAGDRQLDAALDLLSPARLQLSER